MGFNISNDDEIKSEINVTPLVDVMLVLLVIFMISAPLMFNGIQMDLPKTKKVNQINLKKSQIILSISKNQDLYIDKERILDNELLSVLTKVMKSKKTQNVFLRADKDVPYKRVAKTISKLKRGGVTSLSLITELEN